MSRAIAFRAFDAADSADCLALFDANCPEYFAPNERADYQAFLAERGEGYEVCTLDGAPVGAFGVYAQDERSSQLNWILLAPAAQGHGIGSAIMQRAQQLLAQRGRATLRISASHRSAPFFTRFGAIEHERIENGWGPGMHRVEMTLSTPVLTAPAALNKIPVPDADGSSP